VDGWYSASLNSNGYAYVNLTGNTQFRLRFTLDDDNQYFTKGEQVPKRSPKIGCGRTSAPYFRGSFRSLYAFREVLNLPIF
jgi:hypothetical protein